jgi:ribosome-associated protein
VTVEIKDEFIKLGQLMKLAGVVDSGLDAKIFIQDGEVSVNGEIETRRGRKLYDGDEVDCFDNHIVVKCIE